MVKEVLFLVEDSVEEGYIACAVGYSLFAEADSWEDLMDAIQDAVQCHLDESDLPDLIRFDTIRGGGVPREVVTGPRRRGTGRSAWEEQQRATRMTPSHMRLTTTRGGEHHAAISRHSSLRVGTLGAILRDVAEHLGIPRQTLMEALFGR